MTLGMKRILLFTLYAVLSIGAFGSISTTINSIDYVLNETAMTAIAGLASTNNKANKYPSRRSVNIPETVTYNGAIYEVIGISDQAFQNDTILSSVTIPPSVTKIGKFAFMDCKNLNTVNLSDGVHEIGSGAFRNCPLASVTIPPSVTKIGDMAFYYCKNLNTINLPEGLQEIGSSAFSGCQISSIILPYSIESVGDNAFGSRPKSIAIQNPGTNYTGYIGYYTTIIYSYSRIPLVNFAKAIQSGGTSTKIYVPKGCVEAYKAIDPFSKFTVLEFGEETCELQINQGDFGSLTLDIPKNANQIVTIEDNDQWKIESVLFNGNDMTSSLSGNRLVLPVGDNDQNILNVVYRDVLSGIENIKAQSTLHVTAAMGQIIVSGAKEGSAIRVYGIDGTMAAPVVTATGAGNEIIPVAEGQIYLISTGGQTFKVKL